MAETFEKCEKVVDYEAFQSKDFEREKDLCDYLHNHAEDFARDILEIPYAGHDREYCISHDRRLNSGWKARVDFRFNSDAGDIYVECKMPRNAFAEANNAISQLLAYSCVANFYGRKVARIVLITTKYNAILGAIIRKFSLPIEVYIFSKSRAMKMLDDDSTIFNSYGTKRQ